MLTSEGAKRLKGEHEVLLIIDESDLRKPFASKLEHLDTVRDLEGKPVSGFHTLIILGIGESGVRSLLYQSSFSTHAPGFVSVNDEYRKAIKQTSEALRAQQVGRLLWVMDRGFDDSKLLNWIHERGECFVVRSQHPERKGKVRVDGRSKQLQSCLKDSSPLGQVALAKRLFTKTSSKATYRVDIRALKVELEQLPGTDTTVVQLCHPKLAKPWLLLSNLRLMQALMVVEVEIPNDACSCFFGGLVVVQVSRYCSRYARASYFKLRHSLSVKTLSLALPFPSMLTLTSALRSSSK